MLNQMMTTRSPRANQFMREREGRIALRREEERNMVSPYRPAHEVIADGAWLGQSCFIIGGGPSLRGFDFERLRGRGKIIVVNKGFVAVPFADVLFFMDHASFYTRLHRGMFGAEAVTAWKAFKGIKVFLNLRGRKVEDAYSVKSIGRSGIPRSLKKGLYHGNNSGYGAIQFALVMRAYPIFLLGYDMKHDGGVTHWHGGYPQRQPERTLISFRQEIEKLGVLVRATSPDQIINLNPDSALNVFPKMSVDEALR